MSFKVKKTRKHYFFISFILGMIYFLMHFLLRVMLSSSLVATIDMGYLALDGFYIVIFYIKDALDERNMQRIGKPMGATWFEHAPFILLVAFHGAVVALTDPSSNLIILQWIFVILLLIDGIWDLSQDIRAGPNR